MKKILCFGDSNTWGYDALNYDYGNDTPKRMPFDVRWPGRVQLTLGCDYRIIENALNGRTNMRDDPYFPRRHGLDSLIEAMDANAPVDLVVLHMGCNELKAVYALTPGMIAYGFEQLVLAARRSYYGYKTPEILIIAPHPVAKNMANGELGFVFGTEAYEKSLSLGKLYQSIAERHHCAFIDCQDLAFTLNEKDCLHYSREDHAKLAGAVAEKIRSILG